jgi:sorbitol-specific phosphotransferase system component IIBC
MRVTTTVIANAFQFLFLANARLSSAGLLVVLPLLAHLTGGPGQAVAQLVGVFH